MHFSYLLAVLLFLPIWLVLYFRRKDLRDEMLFMGSLVAIGAFFLQAFVWTKDWWQPKTITGTVVGIEDILFGFLVGGIIASTYEEIFREKLVHIRGKKNNHLKYFLIVIFLSSFIGNFTFFYLEMHSYYASVLSMLLPIFLIYYFRRDLIALSLASGLLVALISIPIYWIWFYIDSSAIDVWFHQNISGVRPLGIPIEDLVWFFVTGMFLSPLYELWKGDKLKKF